MRHPLRIYIGLVGLFLTIALLAGGLWLRGRRAVTDVGTVAQRIARATSLLRERESPVLRFDLLDLYGRGSRIELIDARLALPHFHSFSTEHVRQLRHYAMTCDAAGIPAKPEASLSKAWLWAQHQCVQSFVLPASFFQAPPLMHPGGRSYVALALASGRRVYDEGWLREHLSLLHVTELAKLPASLTDPDPVRQLLASLSRPALVALASSQAAVRSGDWLFLYSRSPAAEGGEYRVYPLASWEALNFPYALVERQEATRCQSGEGAYCWVSLPERSNELYAWLAILALAALSLTLGTLAVSRLKIQRRDREDQLFILRTLTHELRTPATGLGLTLESLRDDFDRLPASSQSAFLRLCDEVQRLSRVIAASTRYLRMRGPKDRFEVTHLDSLHEFLEAILEPYQARVHWRLLVADQAFRTDAYWLKVCIVNLVENALAHGKPQVTVTCSIESSDLVVQVSDAGSLQCLDLESLARAASRREDGRGLGLGLGIVLQTVRDLGGSLTLASNPTTTFAMRWRESR